MTAAIVPQFEDTVTRLSLEEALESAEGAILVGLEQRLPFPKWVSMNHLKERFRDLGFGASDHSIMAYRAIAFDEIAEYQRICLARYPDYWTDLAQETAAISACKKAGIVYPVRKRVKPDKLPLTQRQAELVEEVAELMTTWLDHRQVREALNAIHKQPE